MTYTRDTLPALGIHVPVHSLHDYSPAGTSVVVACIELWLEAKRRASSFELSPVQEALSVERKRLNDEVTGSTDGRADELGRSRTVAQRIGDKPTQRQRLPLAGVEPSPVSPSLTDNELNAFSELGTALMGAP